MVKDIVAEIVSFSDETRLERKVFFRVSGLVSLNHGFSRQPAKKLIIFNV